MIIKIYTIRCNFWDFLEKKEKVIFDAILAAQIVIEDLKPPNSLTINFVLRENCLVFKKI